MTEDEFYAATRRIALLENQISKLQSELHCEVLKLLQELVNRIRYGSA